MRALVGSKQQICERKGSVEDGYSITGSRLEETVTIILLTSSISDGLMQSPACAMPER